MTVIEKLLTLGFIQGLDTDSCNFPKLVQEVTLLECAINAGNSNDVIKYSTSTLIAYTAVKELMQLRVRFPDCFQDGRNGNNYKFQGGKLQLGYSLARNNMGIEGFNPAYMLYVSRLIRDADVRCKKHQLHKQF